MHANLTTDLGFTLMASDTAPGQDTDPNAISFASGYNKVVFNKAAKTVAAGAKGTAGGATLVAENFAPGWDNAKGASKQTWNEAKHATRDAWHHVERALPGDADRDGR